MYVTPRSAPRTSAVRKTSRAEIMSALLASTQCQTLCATQRNAPARSAVQRILHAKITNALLISIEALLKLANQQSVRQMSVAIKTKDVIPTLVQLVTMN